MGARVTDTTEPIKCTREVCRTPIEPTEVCTHRDTQLPYCIPCARKINRACNDDNLVPIARPIMWTLVEGRELATLLEGALTHSGWHVALGGGVLHKGDSKKDLDLVVYPHSTATPHTMLSVQLAMEALGFRRVSSADATRDIWRDLGSKDEKTVEVFRDKHRRRVDMFYFAKGMFEEEPDPEDEPDICERCQERCPHRHEDKDE